jgi:hypothetical protein
MNKLVETFWLVSALVIATALALVAVPILAFLSLLVLLIPAAMSAFGHGRRSGPTPWQAPSPSRSRRHRPVIIEASYRRLDPDSYR